MQLGPLNLYALQHAFLIYPTIIQIASSKVDSRDCSKAHRDQRRLKATRLSYSLKNLSLFCCITTSSQSLIFDEHSIIRNSVYVAIRSFLIAQRPKYIIVIQNTPFHYCITVQAAYKSLTGFCVTRQLMHIKSLISISLLKLRYECCDLPIA